MYANFGKIPCVLFMEYHFYRKQPLPISFGNKPTRVNEGAINEQKQYKKCKVEISIKFTQGWQMQIVKQGKQCGKVTSEHNSKTVKSGLK